MIENWIGFWMDHLEMWMDCWMDFRMDLWIDVWIGLCMEIPAPSLDWPLLGGLLSDQMKSDASCQRICKRNTTHSVSMRVSKQILMLDFSAFDRPAEVESYVGGKPILTKVGLVKKTKTNTIN